MGPIHVTGPREFHRGNDSRDQVHAGLFWRTGSARNSSAREASRGSGPQRLVPHGIASGGPESTNLVRSGRFRVERRFADQMWRIWAGWACSALVGSDGRILCSRGIPQVGSGRSGKAQHH